jgi:hypothetical protein
MHRALAHEQKANAELKLQLQHLLRMQQEMRASQQEQIQQERQMHNVETTDVQQIDQEKSSWPSDSGFDDIVGQETDAFAPPDASERVNSLVKRLNETRRYARAEILRLKSELLGARDQLASTMKELAGLREGASESREALQAIREDNARKSKLILQLKAVKLSDTRAIEQWQAEVAVQEERLKRHSRNMATKDQLIKDLKTKYDNLQKQHEEIVHQQLELRSAPMHPKRPAANVASNTATAINDGSAVVDSQVAELAAVPDSYYDANPNLSAAELRNRLRASELDRTRTRNKFREYKEKIAEQDRVVHNLTEECERNKKQASFADNLRTTLAKRDGVIKSLRSQLERAAKEGEDLKASLAETISESEKRIK